MQRPPSSLQQHGVERHRQSAEEWCAAVSRLAYRSSHNREDSLIKPLQFPSSWATNAVSQRRGSPQKARARGEESAQAPALASIALTPVPLCGPPCLRVSAVNRPPAQAVCRAIRIIASRSAGPSPNPTRAPEGSPSCRASTMKPSSHDSRAISRQPSSRSKSSIVWSRPNRPVRVMVPLVVAVPRPALRTALIVLGYFPPARVPPSMPHPLTRPATLASVSRPSRVGTHVPPPPDHTEQLASPRRTGQSDRH